MGVGAYERRLHSLHSTRRLNFFKVILAILCRGMCKNRPVFEGFGSGIQVQTCYGHGGWCMLRGRQTTYAIRRLNYLEGILATWCRGLRLWPIMMLSCTTY